uniref:Beta-defensin-like domain-containing protein n=1 Tax=Pelusios castaneus TaxID=367368 RepID=A0A8C8RQL7_9SAUR
QLLIHLLFFTFAANPIRCFVAGGVCRWRKCGKNETIIGRCTRDVPCCSK